jgi:hypothetical protein
MALARRPVVLSADDVDDRFPRFGRMRRTLASERSREVGDDAELITMQRSHLSSERGTRCC